MSEPPTYDVSASEFNEFVVSVISAALSENSFFDNGHWQDPETKALIVSFDKDWLPFVCYSNGQNSPEKRVYLKPVPEFLSSLVPEFQEFNSRLGKRIRGGRFFFGSEAIWRKDGGRSRLVARLVIAPAKERGEL